MHNKITTLKLLNYLTTKITNKATLTKIKLYYKKIHYFGWATQAHIATYYELVNCATN